MIIALVGWWIGHLLTRRLGRTRAAVADAVSGGDLTLRARLCGRDEVARVGLAFDDMVDRLEQRLETIRLDRDRLILPTEAISEGFILWDPQERLVRCNSRCRELLGAPGERIVLGMSYLAFLAGPVAEAVAGDPADWNARMAGMLERHRKGGCLTEVELRNGRWLRVSKSRLPDGSVIGIYTDITEAKTCELALEASEGQLRAIMNSVDEGIMVLDATARVQVANPAAAAIFGRAVSAMSGRHVDELLVSSDELPTAPAPGQRAEMVGIRDDGSRFPAEVAMGLLCRSGGVRIATVRDVTLQKADRDHILLQATHDELTGLPNRRLFDDRLEMMLRRAARSGELVAVAFSTSTASRASTTAWAMLWAIASRGAQPQVAGLPARQRHRGPHGRRRVHLHPAGPAAAGGCGAPDSQAAGDGAPAAAARRPGTRRHRQHRGCRLSGRRSGPRPPAAPCRRRPLSGQGARPQPVRALRPSARQRNSRPRAPRFRSAPRRWARELSLAYQPQINFRTGRVVGFEALMRWDHPQLGLVSPGTFIPIAEETGQITVLGVWALDRACRDMMAWDRSGMGPLRIAVNVSLRQLQQDDLVGQIERVLAETGLAAERLELEFTEFGTVDRGRGGRPEHGRVAPASASG